MDVNMPEKYADLYLKALSDRKQTLEKKIEEFRGEIIEIDSHIARLTSMPIFNDIDSNENIDYSIKGYEPEWPWTQKIAHFEEIKGKLFKSGEVVDYIIKKEPSLEKAKVRSSISAALSNKLKGNKYLKFKDPVSRSIFYGPTAWFLNNGKPHINFIPDTLKEKLLKR